MTPLPDQKTVFTFDENIYSGDQLIQYAADETARLAAENAAQRKVLEKALEALKTCRSKTDTSITAIQGVLNEQST